MKPKLIRTEKLPSQMKKAGAEAALCLQEELIAVIHGAFEVAMEIAVREVSKLVGQATGDICEEMRVENESLKQRLQEAEAMLDSNQLLNTTKHSERLTRSKCNQKSRNLKMGNGHVCIGVKGDICADHQPHDAQHKHMSRKEEQKTGEDVKIQHDSDASDAERSNGCAVLDDALTAEVNEETSHLCLVRVESLNRTCQELKDQGCDSPPRPPRNDKSTLEQVTVKQEKTEEEREDADCFLDSIKVEDFSPDCMSAVQSKMLEEWKPEMLDFQDQDSDTGPAQEFPNVFQLPDPGPVPEAPPQVYGVHIRTSRNQGLYTCKYCDQHFHLPSLLRRHYGQCQLRLQQCFQPPVAGGKRTRLQLYPPGCSPFRCTECNREFNRMENLKTHLRIHTGERPYTCSVCSKCFRHSGALTRHFRIHTGEKPYVCGQCGKSFRNCGGLKFHQRSHSK